MALTSKETPIFRIDSLLSCKDIQFSTCCQNGKIQIIALYLKRGELLLCLLTNTDPVIRKLPWFNDDVHRPVALAFSPAGSFLLVLSEACHLYTVPAMSMFDVDFKTDMTLNSNDITFFPYPYKTAPVSRRISYEAGSSTSAFKDAANKRTEAIGSAVTWYQTLEECQQIGIVGTTNGDIILVDLLTGCRLAITSVRGTIDDLSICLDNSLDSVLLLISTCNQQYELTLEVRIGWTPEKERKRGVGSADETDNEDRPREHRGRLNGFKRMSVEKLQSIKLKIAETRARAMVKTPIDEMGNKPFLACSPKPVDPPQKESRFLRQYFRGRYVLSSYHPPSQLLAIHSTLTESNPLFVHKLPPSSEECVLTDRMIFVVSENRQDVSVVSSHLSESRIERGCEFNPESILGQFNVTSLTANNDETVIAIYKNSAVNVPVDAPQDWNIDGFQKLIDDCECLESCIVVTGSQLFRVSPSEHIICTALRLILGTNGIVQAERLCKIFGINLSKLLELAGDIDLARLKIPDAIMRFKLASCGPLRITVKLAKLGHCCELLSYSTALLMSFNLASITEHMHISNLLFMAFVHQILSGAGTHLKKKFLSFLETNDYYDKSLGMNVSAQSLLFPAVHKLIISRGLIFDGFRVLGSIIKSFDEDPILFDAAKDEDLWLCLSEPLLKEAYVHIPHVFSTWASFMSGHLSEMPNNVLDRLCRALDPVAPYLRPHLRAQPSDDPDVFPVATLMQLFLQVFLVKLSREQINFDRSLMIPCEDVVAVSERDVKPLSSVEGGFDDSIWPIRKDRKVSSVADECETRVISSGFAHSALIRNGAVHTWGMSVKGCLGHGAGLARHSAPAPITLFANFRIQVSQVSCGRAHTVALTNNGVYAWGSSVFGQLGLGSDVLESPEPRLVSRLMSYRVTRVACGQYHTMCLTSSGQLIGCGWNVHGQLGTGTVENVSVPCIIQTLKEHVITDVACGHGHTLVLNDKGHVMSFGCSAFGQLGHGSLLKSSTPVMVNKISGKVVLIATGYFHNLALTSQNNLYTWGASPQVLRLQSQVHKRARAMNMAAVDGEDPPPRPEVTASESHLLPSLVDTRNISGKITQIACGCHHSALTTETGSVYTWGRSMVLGNGGRAEVVLPSLLQDGSLKASHIALGSDFTLVIEKHSGRVYGWGCNGSRQLGISVKESSAKGLDGKVIEIRTAKRAVRIPNTVANAVYVPTEVPDIPSSTFTYQPLVSYVSVPAPAPPTVYTQQVFHSRLQAYASLVDYDLLLCKCLNVGNHQAASKVLLLQRQYRHAVVHQLKALQKAQKERARSRQTDIANANNMKRTVQTPDAEIHPFTVQGGVEGMCDMVDNAALNGYDGSILSCSQVDISISEYSSAALEILLRFLIYAPDEHALDILETGIQFWTAEKLPMNDLEAFLLEHLERVFYPLGSLLYLGKRDLARHFTAELQLRVTSRLVAHVENNGSCEDFVAALSKLLSLGTTSVADLSNKLQNPPQKAIHVSWPQCPVDGLYVFSCGHSSTSITIPSANKKLAEAYGRLDREGAVDMACPECVCSLSQAQVA